MGSEHDKYAGQVFVWAGTGNPKDVGEVVAKMHARIKALESTERELRDAVRVLATELRSYIMDQAVGDWTRDISDEVNANPIAAAAVREAGK